MDKAIAALSDAERVAHYRERVLQAMDRAQQSDTDGDRAAWLTIASKWAALADEVERQSRREEAIAATRAA